MSSFPGLPKSRVARPNRVIKASASGALPACAKIAAITVMYGVANEVPLCGLPPPPGSASFALAPEDEGIAAADRLLERLDASGHFGQQPILPLDDPHHLTEHPVVGVLGFGNALEELRGSAAQRGV